MAFQTIPLVANRIIKKQNAVLSTFTKLPFVMNVNVLSIYEWPFYTGFSVVILLPITDSTTDIVENWKRWMTAILGHVTLHSLNLNA